MTRLQSTSLALWRLAQSLKPLHPEVSMDACVLSAEEVGRLQHYGLNPCHTEHYHISPQEAIEGLHSEEYELITTPEGRNYLTPVKMYMLAARPSGESKIRVIQRVKMPQLKALKFPR